ncbi:hypothetical protein ACFYZ9_33750 [Streptomyces sp. NPDC001691]|uniref:hypothetical protein n=1 Tax=Streptomyces sp. NPDC001691 TaxID=3364600 RepID=UPI003692BA88
MNLSSTSIEVGVTRVPAPFLAILKDPATVRQAVAHWPLKELAATVSALTVESIRRRESMLVDVLRAMFHVSGAEGKPVVGVEFVTDSPAENGVFWDESEVYLHYENGPVESFDDFTEEGAGDEAYAALDDLFRDLLRDIAADNPPQHGDHLTVDLTTGEYERSGRWAR